MRTTLGASWASVCSLMIISTLVPLSFSHVLSSAEPVPPLPPGRPHPPPAYMKDNVNNFFGTAPDQGTLNGPVLEPLTERELQKIHGSHLDTRQSTDNYWLSSLGGAGQMPFAPAGYQYFRNVKDFGAAGDGVTDDTAAINRAAAAFSSTNTSTLRCGQACGSTTTLGAVVYFPPGTYLISTPIIQYYYTQFVGNPTDLPTISGTHNFTGIALFDSDPYIPGDDGAEWYINQSNFYRQIRNFNFDMTGMNWTNYDNEQMYVPTGIHWQVGQATSITNCNFNMSVSVVNQSATAVGIFMENGSGGMVSDLTFFGGNIGFVAGSQQFTSKNLSFTSCLTAVKQLWNWGFVWKNMSVLSCYIAIDATAYSGITYQGTGSLTFLDSVFNGVPYAITIADLGSEQPNIVLDNLLVENSQSVVLISGGATILNGSSGPLYYNSWASGYQYFPDGSGYNTSGFVDPAVQKSPSLLDSSGAYFIQPKPQYADSSPVVATDHGISNDGTGDQTAAINSLLSANVGSVIFFPGGVYLVQGTVQVPVGSLIVGSGWSQIMGTGSYFEDMTNPQVMVQVGNAGDSGVVEISDMLFTVQGATAGAILMEWNVHESTQGSAAMWDSHFRVGGAAGTGLQLADCPAMASSVNPSCMAATMLMHVTSQGSGYFENVWAWVADHDLDSDLNADAYETDEGVPQNVQTDVSIYVGRGILIESQGPTWFYGSASEHSQLYQWELSNATDIYLGHVQTETPYYQPNPNALSPYTAGQFSTDPLFEDCANDLCKGAWALRIVNSSNVYIYGAGFYSFFQNNQLGCAPNEDCQLALVQTNYDTELWIYNLFTKGNVEIVSPVGLPPLLFNSTTTDGYTSEIAAWLLLSTGGGDIGSENGDGSGLVTIDPDVYSSTSAISVQCFPPCTYVLPPLTLSTETTFSFPPLSTIVELGTSTTLTFNYNGTATTGTYFVGYTTSTVISIPAVTTSVVSFSQETIVANSTVFTPVVSVQQTPFEISLSAYNTNGVSISASSRTFYPPPWPGSTLPPQYTSTPSNYPPSVFPYMVPTYSVPPAFTSQPPAPTYPPGSPSPSIHFSEGSIVPPYTHTNGPPNPRCTHATGCGSSCKFPDICIPCWIDCDGPPDWNILPPDDPPPISIRPPHPGPGNTGGSGEPSPSQSSSQCESTTYSSCATSCVTATSSSSCATTCSNVVGCSISSTTSSSSSSSSSGILACAQGFCVSDACINGPTSIPPGGTSWSGWYTTISSIPLASQVTVVPSSLAAKVTALSQLPPAETSGLAKSNKRSLEEADDHVSQFDSLHDMNLTKRTLSFPENLDTYGKWFTTQLFYPNTVIVPHRPLGDGGSSSALVRPFLSEPLRVKLVGLFGCTSLIIINQRGVYISHLFENPGFTTGQFVTDPPILVGSFFPQVIPGIFDGEPNIINIPNSKLNGNKWLPSLDALFADGAMFDQDLGSLKAIIVTPLSNNGKEPLYQNQVDAIISGLRYNYGFNAVQTYGYVRPNEDQAQSNGSPLGKILVQYDPQQDLGAKYFEDRFNRVVRCPVQIAAANIWIMDQSLNVDPLKPNVSLTWAVEAPFAQQYRDGVYPDLPSNNNAVIADRAASSSPVAGCYYVDSTTTSPATTSTASTMTTPFSTTTTPPISTTTPNPSPSTTTSTTSVTDPKPNPSIGCTPCSPPGSWSDEIGTISCGYFSVWMYNMQSYVCAAEVLVCEDQANDAKRVQDSSFVTWTGASYGLPYDVMIEPSAGQSAGESNGGTIEYGPLTIDVGTATTCGPFKYDQDENFYNYVRCLIPINP